MLETLSLHEWAEDGFEGYQAAVKWRHGDQFPEKIEKISSTIASKPRNINPVLDFLITKGIEGCDLNASTDISGAFATYLSVAKRAMTGGLIDFATIWKTWKKKKKTLIRIILITMIWTVSKLLKTQRYLDIMQKVEDALAKKGSDMSSSSS
ncbi:hypothetical protein C3L33_20169, partial [Rhododendron williamsianum]